MGWVVEGGGIIENGQNTLIVREAISAILLKFLAAEKAAFRSRDHNYLIHILMAAASLWFSGCPSRVNIVFNSWKDLERFFSTRKSAGNKQLLVEKLS